MKPPDRALLDQLRAAVQEALAVDDASAATLRGFFAHYLPGPHIRANLAKLRALGVSRKLERCAHLDPLRPMRAFWFTHTPDLITCPPCNDLACATLTPNPATYVCSACGVTPAEGVRVVSYVLVGTAALFTAAIHVRAGLCHACLLVEESDQRPENLINDERTKA